MHLSPVSFEQCAQLSMFNVYNTESIRGSFSSKVQAEELNDDASENDNYDDDDDDDNDDLMVYDDPGGHPGHHQHQVPQDCQTGKYTEQEES